MTDSSTSPDQQQGMFQNPEAVTEDSVSVDRVGPRSYVGRSSRGVEIPIGHGQNEVSPGELLKIALIGCAGMSSDRALARRLGDDYRVRLWAHGSSDRESNRYTAVREQMQLELDGLDSDTIEEIERVAARAIAAGCTIERTVADTVDVTHELLDAHGVAALPENAEEQA